MLALHQQVSKQRCLHTAWQPLTAHANCPVVVRRRNRVVSTAQPKEEGQQLVKDTDTVPRAQKVQTASQEYTADALPVANGIGEATESVSATVRSSVPARYKMIAATSVAFMLCNMDKINMSVAIIPMAHAFGWSSSVSGTVQASFFWGYLLCQIPGGYLASTLGGRRVLPAGVALWSVMTCLVPALAATMPGLCIARAGVGMGEAVAPSAATDLVARVVPASERSRAVSVIFGGLHVGSVVGLLIAPTLITSFGWEAVFYVFGGMGVAWALWYPGLLERLVREDPEFALALRRAPQATDGAGDMDGGGHAAALDPEVKIPWRAFMRSGPVRALCATHFCHNWLHYTMLTWLPTYFVSTLDVDLVHASQTALWPPLAGIVASALAGPLADGLLAKGLSTPTVRRLLQAGAFLGPCVFLCILCSPLVEGDRTLTVAAITATLALSSFSLGGLYCTHQDMSPQYASVLLGVTNTAGAVPGIIGVATVGFLYDYTDSWQDALFLPSAIAMVVGAFIYCFYAKPERINFDQPEDSLPFAWEESLAGALAWLRKSDSRK